MAKIDLNSDLGESFGSYKIGMDEEIIKTVSSVNIACGWHAGDPVVLDSTIKTAKKYGVGIGAHPGFLDLMGFGRREMAISPKEAEAYTAYQLGAFFAFTKMHGVKIQHVKPHGALYNMAAKDLELAKGICRAVAAFDDSIIILGLSGSEMKEAANSVGLRFVAEFFADRAYEDDGSLVSRRKEGAIIHDHDEVVKRVLKVAKTGMVTTASGKDIAINTQSVCVHGDTKEAVDFVNLIKTSLTKENVEVAPLANIV